MVVPILCLVSLCLVLWVMLLKAEISRLNLKYGATQDVKLKSKAHTQPGNRTFKIG